MLCVEHGCVELLFAIKLHTTKMDRFLDGSVVLLDEKKGEYKSYNEVIIKGSGFMLR